jgi:hypothetical protein
MTPIIGVIDSAKTGRLSTTTYDLITSYTVPSNTGIVSFSSLGAYDDLIVEFAARTDTSNFDTALTINSATSNNYAYNILFSTGSFNGEAATSTANLGRAGYNSYGSTASTSYGSTKFYFPNYRRTDRWKTFYWEGFGLIADNAVNFGIGWSMNRWENTAAISSLQFVFNFFSAQATTGSTFYIYGVNKK